MEPLRSGTVGGQNFRDHTDGVGEVLHVGDDALQSLLHEGAVAVVTAVGAAAGTGFTGGVGGHVVVMHEALLFLFPDGVELLGLGEGGEGRDGEHLGLAAGEEAGTVHAGDQADFGRQGTDLVHGAAVDTLAGEQPLLDDLLLQLVQDLVHVLHEVGVFFPILFLNHGDPVIDTGFTDVLVIGIHAVFHGRKLILYQLFEEFIIKGSVFIAELRLADLLNHLVD